MTVRDYSATAGSNTAVGGVSIAEGCSAANLNNAIRAEMADTATWRSFLEGAITGGGSANAQTLTSGLSIGSYAVPMQFAMKASATNTGGAMTLAVDSLSAKSVKRVNGSDPLPGDVATGGIYQFAYEASADVLFLLNPTPNTRAVPDPGSNGLVARTALGTSVARTLTAPAAGIGVTNGDGVAGNPTLALANDLAALEGLSSTGIPARTTTDTWAQRSIAGTAPITVTNGDGVAGNPTVAATIASAADWQANTATKLLQTDNVWSAAGLVSLTDGTNIAVDLSTGLNFTVTLGGNRTLSSPSNTKVGQSGVIYVVQDGTGSRTLAYGTNYKFAGGVAPTLTTTASAVDRLVYFVRSSTHIDIDASLTRS